MTPAPLCRIPNTTYVLRLPTHGRLLVGTDLQGNLGDFERLLAHFRAAGPEAHLVLTGDLVHGPDDATVAEWPGHLGTPYRDESPALIDAFLAAQAQAPGRVHCLMGNHEHAHVGGPVVAKFYEDEAAALEARLGPEATARWRGVAAAFPLAAIAPCGVALTHAVPAAAIDAVDALEGIPWDRWRGDDTTTFWRRPILGPLLWARAGRPEVVAAFLRAVGANVAIYGHDVVAEGWCVDGPGQLCVSTSFGCLDARKTYVDLDLSARYNGAHALREGRELRRLTAPVHPTA